LLAHHIRCSCHILQHLPVFKQFQRRQTGSTGQRISCVGVTVIKRAPLPGVSKKGRIYAFRGQRCSQRQISSGNPFGKAQKIGLYLLLLAREQCPGAAESCGDFISNQQHVVLVAKLSDVAEISWWVDQNSGRSLNEGFHDDGRCVLMILAQLSLDLVKAVLQPGFPGVSCGNSQRHGGGYCECAEQQVFLAAVKEVNATDTDRAQRVTVVGVADAEKHAAIFTDR